MHETLTFPTHNFRGFLCYVNSVNECPHTCTHLVTDEETDGGRHGVVYFLDEAERDLSYMEMDGKMGLGQSPIRVRSTISGGPDDQAQAAQYYDYYYGQYGGDQVQCLLVPSEMYFCMCFMYVVCGKAPCWFMAF